MPLHKHAPLQLLRYTQNVRASRVRRHRLVAIMSRSVAHCLDRGLKQRVLGLPRSAARCAPCVCREAGTTRGSERNSKTTNSRGSGAADVWAPWFPEATAPSATFVFGAATAATLERC